MTDSVDIKPLPGAGVYQLILPDQVANTLQLTEADGHTLFITHENKMQLEWLGQRIWQQYHSLKNAFAAGKERLKRKRRSAAIILAVAVLTGLFSEEIAGLARISTLYVKTLAFAAGIICCLQLLKYFAKGISLSEGVLVSQPQVSALKESILKDFSLPDYRSLRD
jgi:hypothetical protein